MASLAARPMAGLGVWFAAGGRESRAGLSPIGGPCACGVHSKPPLGSFPVHPLRDVTYLEPKKRDRLRPGRRPAALSWWRLLEQEVQIQQGSRTKVRKGWALCHKAKEREHCLFVRSCQSFRVSGRPVALTRFLESPCVPEHL